MKKLINQCSNGRVQLDQFQITNLGDLKAWLGVLRLIGIMLTNELNNRKEESIMKKINLKEILKEKDITVSEVSEGTGISEKILSDMYDSGEFDGNKVNINMILDIVSFLELDNITILVPVIK